MKAEELLSSKGHIGRVPMAGSAVLINLIHGGHRGDLGILFFSLALYYDFTIVSVFSPES